MEQYIVKLQQQQLATNIFSGLAQFGTHPGARPLDLILVRLGEVLDRLQTQNYTWHANIVKSELPGAHLL